MGDIESEQPRDQDDFEIEITDIDELEEFELSSTPSKPSQPRASQRFSPRLRRLQLVLTTSIVVLAVMLILGSTAPVRELVGRLIIGPTSTPLPALGPGAYLFYIHGNPPWGRLSIDGHEVAHLPVVIVDPPLRLSPGRHVLTWRADPFPAQSCTLTVPARYSTDTCRLKDSIQVQSAIYASIVTFNESLNMLSDAQRASLIQATQAALDTRQYSETVQPGELFAYSPEVSGLENNPCRITSQSILCYAAAKQPLRATLRFQLDVNSSQNSSCTILESCKIAGQDCRLFCDTTALEGHVLSSSLILEWHVLAVARSLWEYVRQDGQIIADHQSDTFIAEMQNEHFVPLSITWDNSGWHVSTLFPNPQVIYGDPVCASAIGDARALANNFVINGMSIQVLQQSVSGADLAAGCVVVITPGDAVGLPPTSTLSPPLRAFCLHRFGVLLAANDLAHRQWPYLPLASTYEQHLAQQLVVPVLRP